MTSDVRGRVLEAVKAGDITWRLSGFGLKTFRHWWLSEYESRPLTKSERMHLDALLLSGEVVVCRGWKYDRGGYEVADDSGIEASHDE